MVCQTSPPDPEVWQTIKRYPMKAEKRQKKVWPNRGFFLQQHLLFFTQLLFLVFTTK
jgi:hypothetical protein